MVFFCANVSLQCLEAVIPMMRAAFEQELPHQLVLDGWDRSKPYPRYTQPLSKIKPYQLKNGNQVPF